MHMHLFKSLLVSCASVVFTLTASAQVVGVNGDGSNLIAGAITSANAFIMIPGHQWSTVPNNSTVASGTTFTAGVSSPGGISAYSTNGLFQPSASLSNASLRGYTQGMGFTGTATTLTARFLTHGAQVTVTIWGPTLNNYGVSGVGFFNWTITSSAGTTSGSGEVNSSGHYGNITVTVYPATFSAGDALIQVNG